ncbi:MAG TPA: DNA mismatch repair protein MutS [Lachnoclostridium phytofermentans]|uniref:DNA mismatch repair protein MutS n=1 Tax=Lachnoclostridium phytofermentans TaxID=66219 RepID=A0A3D2X8Z7_9FIRM|nr:DNA mismatch repair protein MutS [Lachnoclostridium sp.]HCL03083.1 DNA mismatch repair protein MutS [Lachnoclostridium phytofermentans]
MNTRQTLEFQKILEMLCEYAVSEEAKKNLIKMEPSLREVEVINRTKETTEARMIYDVQGNPPMSERKEIEMILSLAKKGGMLSPEQLTLVSQFIAASRRLKSYLTKAQCLKVDLAFYADSFTSLEDLQGILDGAIRNNQIDSSASKELKDIRRKMESVSGAMKSKLEALLRSRKECFSEGFVSLRNGHFVLPVKKEYKHQISGTVHDVSSSGATYFIEPVIAVRYSEELSALKSAEAKEEAVILYTLTSLVIESEFELMRNYETMGILDEIFAKAKLSAFMKAVPASLNTDRKIKIINGRHPLLKREDCVPLNFEFADGIRGVIITGPNTGGKTVALKTVGLLSMMAQSGLHVPCDEADLCMNDAILCDIGDGQSITENLSTFSAHITNIISILKEVTKDSLVLLDELGSGTDPAEGMGIAISILEELKKKQCLFLATTHYPQVKEYAAQSEGIMNAKMAFDRESLKPLYRLEVGEAGESCALYIAKRLGLPKHMLLIAHQNAYGTLEKERLRQNNESGFLFENSQINEGKENTENKENKENTAIKPRIEKKIESRNKEIPKKATSFHLGDSVIVYPEKKIGIVYQICNEKGDVGIQIAKKKKLINYKRIKLHVAATQMYPDDYDFSIVFDTVANRKARHKLEKGHQEGVVIRY